MTNSSNKIVIYQVLPRLFGNTINGFVPWGTKEQNGVGKFNDFTDVALKAIHDLGITHIWLTGVLHHALIGDYKSIGISDDHPDVVKGRAGSPYAIKDYYAVNPDLANYPAQRQEEFQSLIDRIHEQGMKVIIDIVPNHVARNYESLSKPEGLEDFGITDNTGLEYLRNNNFYYIPEQEFKSPDWPVSYRPLGGKTHHASEKEYHEYPARWTGNGNRSSKPGFTDWYETVKLNYGIRPDGSFDFDELPDRYYSKGPEAHHDFWRDKDVPDTWKKMKAIASFWLEKGVDGFRYDMAEMVPVSFWSYLNSSLKVQAPDCVLIAEVYDPARFYDFIHLGKMDYLYDKVDLYDTLRDIIEDKRDCHSLYPVIDKHYSIRSHLLHFLENHDEQRIASHAFAGDSKLAKPAMVLSACIDPGALMLYFGQELGEKAIDNPGFGSETRTSIFDYVRVLQHQKWMNDGSFDGGKLSPEAKELQSFYKKLLNFSKSSLALQGPYYDLHRYNSELKQAYAGNKLYAFARWEDQEKLIILCNFDKHQSHSFRFNLYPGLIEIWNLADGKYSLEDVLNGKKFNLIVQNNTAFADISIDSLESLILNLEKQST